MGTPRAVLGTLALAGNPKSQDNTKVRTFSCIGVKGRWLWFLPLVTGEEPLGHRRSGGGHMDHDLRGRSGRDNEK
jgi:hypothetical protein